ncbi:enoyl-CoA hydratase/isomerase family protein [Paraburkholderia xenovorans LB400]|jgi:enoyl-CoA hydratase|uniref:Enoyl-CoA hydratase/isomerase n=1 Tax=Paraburkholderia xenovorans (strain LB400) TaxID=266265 RepID=Q13PC2_PARXL|nr:enoyl-CoA hydratase-related protein [Paraburkholderia xenovorans]ABE34067.1 Putative enoyl-CoA hydratase/isomerase [Paraburkholderia xenovorans LB400]AIP35380.1 enoyl-CoA hydratase/isomerase family protein [Paraburkholderia xenovorans LB400]
MSQPDNLLIEHFDDGVSLITINREARRNAISASTAIELQETFAEFDRSTQRVAVLTGAGTAAFTAGADVSDMPELWRCVPSVGITTEKPVICAVSGWCVGGGLVMAMMADLLVATEDAKFYYPEARLGTTQGMIAGLAARIPHKVAMEMMLLARPVGAERAYQAGFVNQVVPNGQHVEAALAMARELAGLAPLVLATLKRFVNEGVLSHGPTEHFGNTRRAMEVVAQSEDRKEGLLAQREKRAPKFIGR